MNGDPVLVQTKSCLAYLVIELVNPCIDLSFESFNFFTFGTLHFFDFALHELFHVFWVTKCHLLAPSFREDWSLGHNRRTLSRVL
jgi:hypothetical protein